jgi:hypothetical protein
MADHGYRVTAPRRASLPQPCGRSGPLPPSNLLPRRHFRRREWSLDGLSDARDPGFAGRAFLAFSTARVGRSMSPGAPVHRHHLVCAGCGTAVPFNACPVADLADSLARENNFEVHGHLLEIFGTCGDCRAPVR